MIKTVIEKLTELIGPIATLSKDRRDLKDTALRTISNALDETYLYYRDINKGSDRDPDREAMLVKYWSAASINLRHFDSQLAEICDYKAEYWVNPENYNSDDIDKLKIRLSDVRQAYRQLAFMNKSRYAK